ncbi:MAG TPA: PA0069 family radical SAM protein [Povalibacter sp.]|uniref:PA0069 family radical SAM protein n=1 Tax=Povalibacter sp. TaxID=1962978 RepID=UPI002BDC11D9|nr:PA0069 family radical SAM protein [Povalibacter sp.]HMN44954.1 PA0069 family radical SAM protein [Povalibacter sp.]
MASPNRPVMRTGRGAVSNPEGRFESVRGEAVDDGWGSLDEPLPPLETIVRPDPARSIISRNQSPDIPFDQSINPYRGCEHGCIYCYARPSHGYLNLSPGFDFETRLFYKQDAAKLLEAELAAPSYRCSPITIGANTDPYQPIEREYRVTRSIIEVLARHRHPFSIITKSSMIERDVDLLAPLARDNLVLALVSVTTLSGEIKRTLEPRTASPAARLRAIATLARAGIPVGVMVAPVIPVLTDAEMEKILAAAAQAGARSAGYVLLRLPYEVKDLFREWLQAHEPLKAGHVMSRMQAMRGGRDYDSAWGVRQRGEGEYARLLDMRFKAACKKYGLRTGERFIHNTALFQPPVIGPEQLTLL